MSACLWTPLKGGNNLQGPFSFVWSPFEIPYRLEPTWRWSETITYVGAKHWSHLSFLPTLAWIIESFCLHATWLPQSRGGLFSNNLITHCPLPNYFCGPCGTHGFWNRSGEPHDNTKQGLVEISPNHSSYCLDAWGRSKLSPGMEHGMQEPSWLQSLGRTSSIVVKHEEYQ